MRMADGTEEVLEGGDAIVLGLGHTWAVSADTEFVVVTPIEEYSPQA